MVQEKRGLSAFALRNLAMLLMLIDHIGYLFYPQVMELRYVGRLAFPIFAFLIVEGYFHTHDIRRYLLRLLGLALISDVPYYLMGSLASLESEVWAYVPFKNVIWTFLLGLLAFVLTGYISKTKPFYSWLPVSLSLLTVASYLAFLADSDYDYMGVLMMAAFYFFRGQEWYKRLGLLVSMLAVNVLIAGIRWFEQFPFINRDNFNQYWQYYGIDLLPPQIWAVLALGVIWFYNGKAGYKSSAAQTMSYLFYPLHMLILGLIKLSLG